MVTNTSGTVYTQITAPTPGLPYINQFQFRLVDVPAYTDFTNLYDQYRIKAVKVNFIPVSNMAAFTGTTAATGTAGAYSIRSYSALDFTQDTLGLTTIDQIREYANCKWRPYTRIHGRYFYPKINALMTSGNAIARSPWVSTAGNGPDGQYMGLVFGVDPSTAPVNTVLYQIEIKYYIQFRQAH